MTHENKVSLFANGLIYGLIWLLRPKDCCAQCQTGSAPCQGGILGPGLVNFVQSSPSLPSNVNR